MSSLSPCHLVTLSLCLLAWPLAAAERPRVVLSFAHANCPHCRRLETAWRSELVQQDLAASQTDRHALDTDRMTAAQLDEWKIRAVPVTVLGERDAEGRVVELRRHDGAMTIDELRNFLRGGAR